MTEPLHPLIIVESPSKARTLQKVLGDKYTITASVGHIRDLPTNAIGVDTDNDFKVTYEVSPDKKKLIAEIRKAVKKADIVYLATDPDREGEAISWHLVETLKIDVPVHRLVFHEVTPAAIRAAFSNLRPIDMQLVKAQETRRILDRLVGYQISPILWRRMSPGLSAGRVQSVATRMVVERERERARFTSSSWWDILGQFSTAEGESFQANLVEVDGRRLVTSKDFDRETGALKEDRGLLLDESAAKAWVEKLGSLQWSVSRLVEKPSQSHPGPPFTTSMLQQEGYKKLRFSARRTMQVAQRLYEAGLITYMRTDSTALSSEALTAARSLIAAKFGADYLPDHPRVFKTKVRNAQEAHEAIRPAGTSFTDPKTLQSLEEDQRSLYDLIYRRTLACQMTPARILQTTADISAGLALFQARGKVIQFPGYLAIYREGRDDINGDDKVLPALREGASLPLDELTPRPHETKPPARYTEATLIKELEAKGIGRPSTYASIMETIQRREYAIKRSGALVPTFTAMAVVKLMESNFSDLVDYNFTARMEDVLDQISLGKEESLPYLKRFYFGGNGATGFKDLLEADIDIRAICTIPLGLGADGTPIDIRIGRYGPFLEYGETRTNIDPELPPADINLEMAIELLEHGAQFPKNLGQHPDTGQPVLLKKGRYGVYFQLGDDEHKEKQKSLLPGMSAEEATLEMALQMLALPKELGLHPETGDPVLADLGRYGPYVKSGRSNKSLTAEDELLTITLDRAVELLATKTSRGATELRMLGEHPQSKADVTIKSGRYGPYLTDGTTNVSLRKGEEPDSVTLESALERLAEKAANSPVKRKRRTAQGRKQTTARKKR